MFKPGIFGGRLKKNKGRNLQENNSKLKQKLSILKANFEKKNKKNFNQNIAKIVHF